MDGIRESAGSASLVLSEEHLAELGRRGAVVERREGEVLVRQGEHSDHVFVVLSGKARVELDGREVDPPVAAGECIGELAVLDARPRAATVTTVTPMRLLSFTSEEFAAALDEVPGLRDHVTRALTRRLREANSLWSQLAVDADVLLEAFVALQGSPEPADRASAVREAAALVRRVADEHATAAARISVLTPAETRVAELVADGLSNAAIAARLFLSEHTVASHLKHAFTKLGCTSRVALAVTVLQSR